MTGLLSAEVAGKAVLVRVHGSRSLTAAEAGRLDEEVDRLPSAASVVLDLSELERIDGAGIGALVRWQRRLTGASAQLRLAAPSREVGTMLQLLRLHRLFEIYDGVEEALDGDGLLEP